MRNLKNACAKTALVATCFLLTAASFAQRGPRNDFDFNFNDDQPQRRRDHDNNGRDRRDDRRDNHGPQTSSERLFIGQTMFPGDRLFLGRELGLRNHQGKEIEAVELHIEGMRRGGQATLTINQRKVSRVQDFRGGRVGDQMITFPLKRSFVIGQNVQKLQVEFQGTAYVRQAVVIFKKKPQRGQNSVEQQVSRDILGLQNIPLTRLMQVRPRQANRPVKSVTLTLRNRDQIAQARLCEDQPGGGFRGRSRRPNCQNTQLIQGRGRHTVTLQGEGLTMNELSLFIRGDLMIKKVSVKFRRN
jgi:hypothetical protein